MSILKISELDNNCTGCFACSMKCPAKAIQMELNEEGFYYPVIAEDKCVSCGLCVRICQQNAECDINSPNHIYSAYAKDETVRQSSSSGGIFGLLANVVLSYDGIVYGAAFDKGRKEVCHTSTDETQLANIMRSKYVQSRIGGIYDDVEKKLQAGRKVLFGGTPCQVKGLHAYLQKEFDNLFTVDFMCHGVPSTGLFKNVIDYCERSENAEVVDFTFREKDFGWRDQVTKIYLSNGKVLSQRSSSHYYYFSFLNNYTLRKSCFDCNCYNSHQADITLADNWETQGDDGKGTSLILVNTEKGDMLYTLISDLTHTTDYKSGFRGYEIYRHNYSEQNRAAFFTYYLKHGFNKTLSVFFKKAMLREKLKRYAAAAKTRLILIVRKP